MNLLHNLFSSGPFMPHGHCYFWTRDLIALHTVSDALIVLAYYSIPLTLVYFVRKRKDIAFNWMFVCFAVFIMACGTTHLMEIWNIWHANYWVSGSIKALTAVASVPTAILLLKLVPQALALPSTAQLNRVNEALQAEIAERKQVEARLREVNEGLEARVNERSQELRHSNDALRVSEERFRLVVEAAPNAMLMTDDHGRITLVNGQTEQLFGYTRDELLRQPVETLVPERYRGNHPGHRAGFFRQPSARPMGAGRDLYGRRKDGSEVPIEIGLNPLRSGEGAFVLASIIDITARKQAEQKIRESEERMRLAQQVAQVGTFEWNIATGVSRWTPEMEAVYGLAPGTFAGTHETWENLVHPEDRAEAIRSIALALESGTFGGEWRVIWPDGSVHWLAGRGWAFKDDAGRPLRVVGVNIDITERKLNEQKLRENEERLLLAQQVARVGTFEWNVQTGANRWTPELEAMYGLRPGGFVGPQKSWEQLIHPDDRAEAVQRVSSAMETGSFEGEWRVVWEDGTVRWVAGRAFVFKDDSGKPLRMVGVNIDITERKLAEQEIQRLNTQLEQRVAERTAELEAANRELEAFSYSITHDLRAPVRAMGGFARIVSQDFAEHLPPQGVHQLDRIQENASKMGQLIDGLLAFSGLSRQTMNKRAVEPRTIVQRVLHELQSDLSGRRVEISTGDLPACEADPTLLQQVYANLISNALKYTRDRDPAVIAIGCRQQNGEQAYFVKDNGAGFDMKYAGKLFGVFQRLHRAEEFEGTGVGLAIVQRIVHRHV